MQGHLFITRNTNKQTKNHANLYMISSAESQKGAIADQRYSVENQKGAIAIDFVQH